MESQILKCLKKGDIVGDLFSSTKVRRGAITVELQKYSIFGDDEVNKILSIELDESFQPKRTPALGHKDRQFWETCSMAFRLEKATQELQKANSKMAKRKRHRQQRDDSSSDEEESRSRHQGRRKRRKTTH